jgi:cyclic-di-GMP phosphodiesterase TipF (flagellum assembly factor)
VQGLVYIFIVLAAVGVAGTAYFGLTFTPIEAAVTAIAFGCLAVMLVERQLRQRAETRLEKAIEDLSRLLSTDAQAGSLLNQRINTLTDINAAKRLESLEADVSVLGAVVQQVTETVADLEERRRATLLPAAEPATPPAPDPDAFPEPVIPLETLKSALDEHRLVFHIEPIVTLPQRRPQGYDLVPRLQLEEEELADPADFMPRHGGDDTVMRIEADGIEEAVVIARRSRTAGSPITLYVPLSRATLNNVRAVEQVLAALDANRAIAGSLLFALSQEAFRALSAKERASVAAIGKMGVGLSLTAAASLRVDYAELQGLGFCSIRVDATKFLRQPETFTEFHAADVATYGRRFGIELIATGLMDEQQLLALFENGVTLVQGPYIARPGPVRPDLVVPRAVPDASLRVEG